MSVVLLSETTIRDGIKTLGRTEDEPLVFFKKDRNTLESRKDLQGDTFEIVCQQLNEQFGQIDILINAAGISVPPSDNFSNSEPSLFFSFVLSIAISSNLYLIYTL